MHGLKLHTLLSGSSCLKTYQPDLCNVKDFKYLGSSLPDSFHDFKCRKAQAWVACNKLEKIWKSKLDRTIKIKFFRACVKSILLYGSETWTVTQKSAGHQLAGSPDKQKGVRRYSSPVSLIQKASSTVCWPLFAHIRPTSLQLDPDSIVRDLD